MTCILIAELSCNHGGDLSLAEDMISSAASNGADYVKFQTWQANYLKSGEWDKDGRRELYEIAELKKNEHFRLKECCEKNNVRFLTSCFSLRDLDFIRTVTNEIKIPSPECSNRQLVEQAIKQFDKVFISVGSSTYDEYKNYAVHDNVFLLHCVSCYPCSYNKINLPKMLVLQQLTDRYGYSGHAEGVYDALAAISLGAKVVEKHFTIDQKLPFRDNKFSILPDELKTIKSFAESFNNMMINRGRDFQPEENIVRNEYAGRWQ